MDGNLQEILRAVIRVSGQSQAGVAKGAGVPQPGLSHFLAGKDITLRNAAKLADYFGLSLGPRLYRPPKQGKRNSALDKLQEKRDLFFPQYNAAAENCFRLEKAAAAAREKFHELLKLYEAMDNKLALAAGKARLSNEELIKRGIDPKLVALCLKDSPDAPESP